ncbi:AraC family transcriptional regulator [Pedobacter nutrimenti]|uniref:AraC-like DNA-binding protein n=1 Tax=Pedobacter nutrimenti TaxID=1241337 RepID=A0A318UE81_9SPHI|nr:AraC family transcriptional regulator [Pedobacter nutrimenti]PYF74704.1 AraC-like DNA-binding protein [Pedobacter nutrimenti]
MGKNGIDPIVVKQITLDKESLVIRSKNELTIVYVLQGKGIAWFDSQQVPFKKGRLFMIPFDMKYVFQGDTSDLLVIECPQTFVTQIRLEADRLETCDNINKLTYITNNYHTKTGCVFYVKEDGILAEQLLKTVEREHVNHTRDYLITRQCIAILLNLVARNLIQADYDETGKGKKGQDVMKIITYIQKNIGNKSILSIEALAMEFKMAKNYIGEYFKKQTGVSIQDYILDYRLKLVEIRLKHSTMRLKEIAFELDFNDESHLSKLFKKHKQITPYQYRVLHRTF